MNSLVHIHTPTRTLELAAAPLLSLAELMRREGIPLNTRCGQRGLCDGCLVNVSAGTLRHLLTTARASSSLQACQYAADSPVTIHIDARSLLAYEPQIVSDFDLAVGRADAPIVDLSPGDVLAAIDIGTTTLAVLLVEPGTGTILARAAAFNRQMHFGDDVLTRITLCAGDPAMLAQLQHAVARQTILPLLAEALAAAAIQPARLRAITVAGNTTMLHLLAGIDPTPMGTVPFTPAFLTAQTLSAAKILGEGFNPDLLLHLLPGASAYVGADLVAGALATGLAYDDGPTLLVDVGTNGEMILKHGDTFIGCATAAGPAFEGAGLTSGIRAGHGAIAHITLTPDGPQCQVIGDADSSTAPRVQPIGLCGSAYIDFLAEGRRTGLLGETGRFSSPTAPRVIPHGTDLAYHLADAQGKRPILITQADIAKLLAAKAAIAAGVETLLSLVNLRAADVKHVHLAGGFGAHMSVPSAIACGLLPGFTPDQVRAVGNSSLAGAYLTLLDRSLLDEMSRLAPRIRPLELNTDPNFESRFIDHLMLA